MSASATAQRTVANPAPMRAVFFMLAVLIALTATATGPGSTSAAAQESARAPDYFSDCDKQKFDQLPDTAKEGISQQDREQQPQALESAAAAEGVNCTEGGEKDPTQQEVSGEEDPEQQQEMVDEGQKNNDEQKKNQEESDQQYEDQQADEGGLPGLATQFFNTIGTHIWDWSIGWLGQKMAADIGDALLYLPDPSADEQMKGVYEDVKKVMHGLLVVGIIVMSLALVVRSANTGLNFAGLKMLPRIFGVAIVLGALPSLFGVLSTLGTDLTSALMPNSAQIDEAKLEMTKAVAGNLIITNFLNLILALIGVYVLFVLIAVALLKSIVFVLLFIAAPFPLIASLVPGFGKYASIWVKAVLVTAFIPAIWAAELWIGAILIDMPQELFGQMVDRLGFLTNGMFTTIIAIGMFYLIYKTPFIAMSWAIPSYNPSWGGSIWSAGSFAAKTAAAVGIKSAVGGAIGAFAGGAKGSQSDPPSRGERPPMDSLGGKLRENKRITNVTTTDHEGNERTSRREEHTVEANRDRQMMHDEAMQHFGPKNTDGPAGSPPPPQTQTFESGGRRGRGGRLNRGDDPPYEDGRTGDWNRSRDGQRVLDPGEE